MKFGEGVPGGQRMNPMNHFRDLLTLRLTWSSGQNFNLSNPLFRFMSRLL